MKGVNAAAVLVVSLGILLICGGGTPSYSAETGKDKVNAEGVRVAREDRSPAHSADTEKNKAEGILELPPIVVRAQRAGHASENAIEGPSQTGGNVEPGQDSTAT